jgi:hypothetical protein
LRTYAELEKEFFRGVRRELLEGLGKCTTEQQHFFKRMYAGGNLEKALVYVVGRMAKGDLACAMDQVHRTIEKNKGAK